MCEDIAFYTVLDFNSRVLVLHININPIVEIKFTVGNFEWIGIGERIIPG